MLDAWRPLPLVLATLLIASSTSAQRSPSPSGPKTAAPPVLWTSVPKGARPLVSVPSVAPIVERVEPAVLVVFTEGPISDRGLPPGHPPMPSRPEIPGMPPMPDGFDGPQVERGQGAGFLVTRDGYALTNHHVVEGATRVTVFVGEAKDEIEADVIGSDEKSDVAVIKLRSPRTNWPVLPLADSDAVKVGDFVIAIGSPFGLEQSVSLGIVSARGRRDVAPSGRQGLYDFLQTDASINPGNSGGPLLDVYGAVVGINAAVNAAGAGIGFAIPINQVKRMLPSMVSSGRFERSWLGVSIQSVDPDLVTGLGLPSARGALIKEVVVDGPAAAAGVKPGDVITGFDGHPVLQANALPLMAGDAGVGTVVAVDLYRDGKKLTLSMTLGSHPDNVRRAEKEAAAEPQPTPTPSKADANIGMSVVDLDAAQIGRLELPSTTKGARVTKVRPGSPAFLGGLLTDDVITSVDGVVVTGGAAFAAAVKKAPAGAVLKFLVQRGSSTVFVAVKKP